VSDINKYNSENNDWYNQRMADLDGEVGIRILSSGTKERREDRLKVLTDIGVTDGVKVLDVGCGLADYFTYLKELGIKIDYTGVDINEKLISNAKSIYPSEIDLQVRDFLEHPFKEEEFDFVVCSQVLNLRIEGVDNTQLAKEFLSEMYRISKVAVACDFITNYTDFQEDYLYYHSPEELFGFSKSITKRVSLRHDLKSYEFCLHLFKDFKGWR
jgi:ubiquinone/menaquinone biosynthesis C-methylase UbiE